MKTRFLSLITGLLISTAAIAHEPSEKGEWNGFEAWKLVSASADEATVLFLAEGLTKRAGAAVQTELLMVLKNKDEESNGDQVNIHLLVDCSTLSYMETERQSFGPDGVVPPSIIRLVPQTSPPEGTVIRRALDMACGTIPTASAVIPDPYSWARARLDR